jgi:hypothetical protein
MVMKSNIGNVNFVFLITKYLLKMKKNHKVKLWTISLKQLHKFKIKKLTAKKIYQLCSVLINQDQCAAHSLFKANIKLKETKWRRWMNSWNLVMDPISFYKEREMLLMWADCNAYKLLSTNRSLICKMEPTIEN